MKSVMVVCVALALAGCSGPTTANKAAPSGDSSGSAAAGVGDAPATPAATAASTPSAAPSPVLPDGRSPVYLTGLDATKNTVTFDLIEFLTGEAAKAEWKKQHPDQPDGPDNDYMIINNNTKLRTLPAAAGATCVVLATLGGTDTKTITFAALPAFLEKQNEGITIDAHHLSVLPFWLTVRRGSVVKLEEQFLP
ncbi:hypothetical protein ACIA5D_34160 [Actinoplanes sp. NPDC051513]|uniref:hypothetical protein n=1 Tax=Actinoplanes sp. NPDC051513 TaxID=3363908 RepID=UPI00378CA652